MTNTKKEAPTKGPQVTLKRRVTVKAIVTEKFKQYLRLEVQETKIAGDARLAQINEQLPKLSAADPTFGQLAQERQQIEMTLRQLPEQEKLIEELEDGTHFSQGTIDGFVSVQIGDNLYEKLGGMEILVKDGIVEKMSSLPGRI